MKHKTLQTTWGAPGGLVAAGLALGVRAPEGLEKIPTGGIFAECEGLQFELIGGPTIAQT